MCVLYEGTLAEIETKAENDFLKSFVRNNTSKSSHYLNKKERNKVAFLLLFFFKITNCHNYEDLSAHSIRVHSYALWLKIHVISICPVFK